MAANSVARDAMYVEVTRPDTHGGMFCIYPIDAFSARDEFDGAPEGDSITLTLKRMTPEQFKALPDFEGW